MVGASSVYWLTVEVDVMIGSPSEMRPTSKLVPPTSAPMMLRCPSRLPRNFAATMPPAGPEESVLTERSSESDARMAPPMDCITRSGESRPRSRSEPCSLDR